MQKVKFYSAAFLQHWLVPDRCFRKRLNAVLKQKKRYDTEEFRERLDYYCQINDPFSLSAGAVSLSEMSPSRKSAYYYDYRSYLRFFPATVRCDVKFGDVNTLCSHPALVKSRPLSEGLENNILLKLNTVRHFIPIKDPMPYREKIDQAVWRGANFKPWRQALLQRYWDHPLCEVGQVNPAVDAAQKNWVKSKMSIAEQLRYKFILSIEGNDVATNLKWIAQSNSLCFMPEPRYETWMMEARLEAGKHYVQIQRDFTDLEEKMEFYLQHADAAEEIIRNMQRYYAQFQNAESEFLLNIAVVEKYLKLTNQAV